MKSAIYLGQKNVEVREVAVPEIGDNDVLIRNIYSSICGTDVAVYMHGPNTGHKVTVGGEFGHETVSRIVKTGKNIKDFKVGDRVYPYPRYAKDDTSRAGTLGGFSEYIHVPNARLNHSLYFLPENISDRTACLIEPFTVGCRAARRGQPKQGENAVVFGCGTIGIAAAIALKYFVCDKVMICDFSDYRLNIAEKIGFQVCNTGKYDFRTAALEYFGEGYSPFGAAVNADIFIDAAGAESILDSFIEWGTIGSRFVSVAVNNAARNVDLLHMTYAQQSIIGSGGYFPEDVRDVLAIMSSGKWDIESIITHEFSVDEISEAIEKAGDSSSAFNVIINFSLNS